LAVGWRLNWVRSTRIEDQMVALGGTVDVVGTELRAISPDRLAAKGGEPSSSAPRVGDRFVAAGAYRSPSAPLAPGPIVQGRTLAVVIGVSDAPSRPELSAGDDAIAFTRDVLLGQLRLFPDQIRLLTDRSTNDGVLAGEVRSPTADQARDALDWLTATAMPGDLVIVSIACHGEIRTAQDTDRMVFILGDGQELAADELLLALDTLPDVVNLVVADSCFSGSLGEVHRALVADGRIAARGVRIILSSSARDKQSYMRNGTGLFHEALGRVLADPRVSDVNGDGFLSAAEIFGRVGVYLRQFTAEAPERQQPELAVSTDGAEEIRLIALRAVTKDDVREDFLRQPPLGSVTSATPVIRPVSPPLGSRPPSDDEMRTFYIYRDAETGSGFPPTGYFPTGEGVSVDERSETSPRFGKQCVRIHCGLSQVPHVGAFFLLDGNFQPSRSFNLFEALAARPGDPIRCRFWARSKDGAVLQFQVGGVNNGDIRDSLKFPIVTPFIRLTPQWRRYELDLTNTDLTSLVGAFKWMCDRKHNGDRNVSFDLDDVYFAVVKPASTDGEARRN
jgi:hypothetical protein